MCGNHTCRWESLHYNYDSMNPTADANDFLNELHNAISEQQTAHPERSLLYWGISIIPTSMDSPAKVSPIYKHCNQGKNTLDKANTSSKMARRATPCLQTIKSHLRSVTMTPPSPTSLFTSVHILMPDEQTVRLTPVSVKRVLSRIRHCKVTGLNYMHGCKLKGCVEQLKNDVLHPCRPLEGTVVMTVSNTKFLEVHNADDLTWSTNTTTSPRIPINAYRQHNVTLLVPTENIKNCRTYHSCLPPCHS